MSEGQQDHAELFVSTRGAFIRRMVAAGFAVPMVGSFGLTELASAACGPKHSYGNQTGDEEHNPYPVDRSHHHDNDEPPVDTSHQLNNQFPPTESYGPYHG